MDVGIGEGCLQDVWTKDWCEHEVEMVGGGMWTGIEKRLKGDRRSLMLHGPHTPGTSRSCQILASHQGFSRREQHTSFLRKKSYTSCSHLSSVHTSCKHPSPITTSISFLYTSKYPYISALSPHQKFLTYSLIWRAIHHQQYRKETCNLQLVIKFPGDPSIQEVTATRVLQEEDNLIRLAGLKSLPAWRYFSCNPYFPSPSSLLREAQFCNPIIETQATPTQWGGLTLASPLALVSKLGVVSSN